MESNPPDNSSSVLIKFFMHSQFDCKQWTASLNRRISVIIYPLLHMRVMLGMSRMLWVCQSFVHCRTSLVSFTQSLLEPGSAGPPGEAQHSDPGLQQLHVSCQVSLHAEYHHSVHQQEQDQQPACFCGGDLEEVPQHQVSRCCFSLS